MALLSISPVNIPDNVVAFFCRAVPSDPGTHVWSHFALLFSWIAKSEYLHHSVRIRALRVIVMGGASRDSGCTVYRTSPYIKLVSGLLASFCRGPTLSASVSIRLRNCVVYANRDAHPRPALSITFLHFKSPTTAAAVHQLPITANHVACTSASIRIHLLLSSPTHHREFPWNHYDYIRGHSLLQAQAPAFRSLLSSFW